MLYRFQVYNSIIHFLYIVLRVHHPKSNLLPSPFLPPLPSSTSSTPFPSGNHHTIICAYGFFLNPFTFFTQSHLDCLQCVMPNAAIDIPIYIFWSVQHISVAVVHVCVHGCMLPAVALLGHMI